MKPSQPGRQDQDILNALEQNGSSASLYFSYGITHKGMMDREAIQNWKIMHQMLFKLADASLVPHVLLPSQYTELAWLTGPARSCN